MLQQKKCSSKKKAIGLVLADWFARKNLRRHSGFNNAYPPASKASTGVYWNQAQKNFILPYTENYAQLPFQRTAERMPKEKHFYIFGEYLYKY